ncbi:MAG: replication-associated recombination protein A [Phycisphaerales bacterium]|nr:replication-associated recombination protein A [Phycisphaerales bacterium]
MPDLFHEQTTGRREAVRPLADRMRPRSLSEFVGQETIIGPGSVLRRMMAADRMPSVILWGSPGTGKTALAGVIANETKWYFESHNAAMIGVADIRRIIDDGLDRIDTTNTRTLLFLEEIHRFHRGQQDVLLDAVERGILTLIGATTENPAFTVNNALVSRSTVFRLEPLCEQDILSLLHRAMAEPRGLGSLNFRVSDDALHHWASLCDGDARIALNALEVAALSAVDGVIDLAVAEESMQRKAVRYDGQGHYDCASALIKSTGGSDPDAAIYWLACMFAGGEDPRFIARRLSILASEDIGLAEPRAMEQAAAAWHITERIGMPECQFALSQLTIFLANAPKSNAAAQAIWHAMDDVEHQRTVPVPKHLAGSGGEGYRNPHKEDAADQVYLGVDRTYWNPEA